MVHCVYILSSSYINVASVVHRFYADSHAGTKGLHVMPAHIFICVSDRSLASVRTVMIDCCVL